MSRAFTPKVVTANRLLEGDAVWLTEDDRWSPDMSEAELIAFCRERLAGFKTPKRVVFLELPKTSTGKIQKFELRTQVRAM